MNSTHSISVLFASVKAGDPAAAQRIWERYLHDLVRMLEGRLAARGQRKHEAEDLATEAFVALFEGIRWDRFAQLHDRQDLWQILVMLSARRLEDRSRRALAQKRGRGKVRGESIFGELGTDQSPQGLDQIADAQPTPEDAAEVEEQFGRLLQLLTDDAQRQIALLKLANYSNQEIAEKLQTSLRSVERKLALIRRAWQAEFPS